MWNVDMLAMEHRKYIPMHAVLIAMNYCRVLDDHLGGCGECTTQSGGLSSLGEIQFKDANNRSEGVPTSNTIACIS
jgi:hypothetical protein